MQPAMGFPCAYLHFIGDILFHACHGGRAAQGTIRRHMNALLVAPLQHSVIPPVCMHLNLQPSHTEHISKILLFVLVCPIMLDNCAEV